MNIGTMMYRYRVECILYYSSDTVQVDDSICPNFVSHRLRLLQWMVVEARRLVDKGDDESSNNESTAAALNAMGYEEAAQHVYGITYGEWKKRHQKKATEEQMEKYNASKSLHAAHDKTLLAARGDKPALVVKAAAAEAAATKEKGSRPKPILSNVCCQDADEVALPVAPPPSAAAPSAAANNSRVLCPFAPPALPTTLNKQQRPLTIGILTVSDRAFNGEYATGDLSGPAVQTAVQEVIAASSSLEITFTTAIVPDNAAAIQSKLQEWSDHGTMDLILTTGGTGMSARDVTPEATRAVVHVECAGLMSFVTAECSHQQPLASLSRGTAGVRGQTTIANLPGNPKGVGEIIPLLLPLLLHALADLKTTAAL
jgi:gephyrin